MTEEYNNKNNYGYNYVRITDSNIGLNLEMLQPRDIYLTTGHTAIIAGGDYLNMGQIQTLQFNRDIDVSMLRYQDIIDIFIPENFMISGSYIKKIIAKAVLPEINKVATNADKIDFKIRFSDDGVYLGQINLLELKAENSLLVLIFAK